MVKLLTVNELLREAEARSLLAELEVSDPGISDTLTVEEVAHLLLPFEVNDSLRIASKGVNHGD